MEGYASILSQNLYHKFGLKFKQALLIISSQLFSALSYKYLYNQPAIEAFL
jgi:hypothetical protein